MSDDPNPNESGQDIVEAFLRESTQGDRWLDEIPDDFRSGFVAVVGQPNVGKSTLMNRLIGQKVAIVSSKPQTTRRRILGILSTDEAQLVFVDTPGIHEPHHKLGEYMNQVALGSIPDADLIVFVVDVSRPPDEQDEAIARQLRASEAPVLLVINKIDLVPQDKATAHFDAYQALGEWAEALLISATEGHGVEAVTERIIAHLPPGPPFFPPGQVTDQTERVIAAELVREAALRYLEQEVPHSLNVEVTEWEARPNGVTYIGATIFVERDSQKGIVIGAGGKMLKRISSEGRRAIEEELGLRVYLDLWVKVREKWRNSESWLNRWGYKPES